MDESIYQSFRDPSEKFVGYVLPYGEKRWDGFVARVGETKGFLFCVHGHRTPSAAARCIRRLLRAALRTASPKV